MVECEILGVKMYSVPSYIFSGGKDPLNPLSEGIISGCATVLQHYGHFDTVLPTPSGLSNLKFLAAPTHLIVQLLQCTARQFDDQEE